MTAYAAHRRQPRHRQSPSRLLQLEAILAAVAAVLFLAVFTAGYNEVNLFAATARTAQLTWTAATNVWTYAAIGAALAGAKALRVQRG